MQLVAKSTMHSQTPSLVYCNDVAPDAMGCPCSWHRLQRAPFDSDRYVYSAVYSQQASITVASRTHWASANQARRTSAVCWH